jgi:hypothetical protein
MAQNKISIFDKPEQIDAIINAKLAAMPANGGKANSKKNAWTQEELEVRNAVIMQYICDQGLSRERTAQQITNRWNISIKTARSYVKQAIEAFTSTYTEEDYEKQRQMWLARCEQILQDAIDTGDKQSALKALDLIGKSMGIYNEKKDVNVNGDIDIKFDFN